MKDLEKIIGQHTTDDGVIDYPALEELINGEINNIVAKNKPNTDKLKEELKGEVAKELISGLGLDGSSVDDLKLWAKKMAGNTDEFKETNIKLEQELKAAQVELEAISSAKSELESNLTNNERLGKIRELGIKDNETAEFIKFKLDKVVSDDKDFDTALNEFREQSPSYFRQKEVTTFRRVPNADSVVSDDKDADVLRAFEAKHNK